MPKRCDFQDIVGRRFGRLMVTEYLGKFNRHHKYECMCDCGNVCEVFRDNLLSKNPTSSCSHCWSVEDEGDHLRYFCSDGDSFVLDRQDYKAAWQHRWFVDKKGYAKSTINGKTIEFARYVLGLDGKTVVDHISRNTRDNRRMNLRVATRAENACNEVIRTTNHSGFKGVSLHRSVKYRADIGEKLTNLGLKEYNPYEIVKRTHGVSYNDFIWFRFPGEKLTSKDVLVR